MKSANTRPAPQHPAPPIRPGSRPGRVPAPPPVFPVGPLRRTVDVVVSLTLLTLATPVLLVVIGLMLLTDGRPVLYHQDRVGEGGRTFRLVKLRSMRTGVLGSAVTATDDPRITPLGRFLRRSCLDELPQLWHVLRGQMTLVGPRPESVALAERYPLLCRSVLTARPGLTGPAQLRFRERSAVPAAGWTDVEKWYLEVLVPARVQADLTYLRRPTLRATLRLLVLTALFVVGLVDLQAPVQPWSAGIPAQRTPEA